MQKRNLGNLFIFLLLLVNVLLWLVFQPVNDGREHFNSQWLGEILSTGALILMSVAIFLANRPRYLESYFGGLDRMYLCHRQAATLGLTLVLAHFLVITLGRGFSSGVSLGKISMIGLLLLAILSLSPRIPFVGGYIRLSYHHWRFTHRFIGLFFVIGLLHHFRVQNLLQTTPVTQAYVLGISAVGVLAYMYKELLAWRLGRYFDYVVEEARQLNGNVIEVTLRPVGERLPHFAGQFLFVGFPKEAELKEPHPFTISSAPDANHLKLAIRAAGDFTQRMHAKLAPGMVAQVQGGYGGFDYKTGALRQVWVAGGIGITPFLSWLRDFGDRLEHEIDFYYTVRSSDEFLYLDEIQTAAVRQPHFRPHIHITGKDGRLTAEKIVATSGSLAGKDMYLCGPFQMTESLRWQMMQLGVAGKNIHYEEFNFR